MFSSSILVVDDDHDTRVSIREILEERNCSVVSATNGKSALEYLQTGKTKPDLILLDLMMPIMNGWEFLSIIKNHPELKDIPILVLSMPANKNSLSKEVDFVPKPLNLNQIRDFAKKARKQYLAHGPSLIQ